MTTPQPETCPHCRREFPTFADVMFHPCPVILERKKRDEEERKRGRYGRGSGKCPQRDGSG